MTLQGRTVLVLEDEPIIAFALEDILLDEGAHPVFCGSMDAARTALASSQPDLAILDVNIHGEKSYSIAAMLTERGIPFIFASGYGGALHPPEFVQVPTVSKPYRLAELQQAFAALPG